MRVTCPGCGAEMTLDVLLAHEDSRRALARLAAISLPLGAAVMRYLALFRPGQRQMSHSRVVALVEELLPDLSRGAITRKGREWPAPRESWRLALETVLEARDKGSLTLPLKSHGYLYEVLAGMADKVEAHAERQAEEQRRGGRAYTAGPSAVADVIAGDLVQRGVVVEQGSSTAPTPTEPAAPTSHVLRLKAQIERHRAARERVKPPDGDDDARRDA